MKLFLVLVSTIAVFTVDGQDFSNEPAPLQTAKEDQLSPDGTEHHGKSPSTVDDENETQDSVEKEHQRKEENGEDERQLKRFRCKARNACVVMGGFCVTNATLCTGRVVPEGCKGPNCQCCVPGTIEAKFDNFEQELLLFNENMNNSDANLESEFQSLKENLGSELQTLKENMNLKLQLLKESMNISNSDITAEFQSLNDNMNTSLSNLNSKMNSLDGFKGTLIFPTKSTTKLNWSDSVKRCQDMGAQPFIPRTSQDFQLIKNLRTELGHYIWLPASDTSQEGTLKWWNGEAAPNGSPGLEWWSGNYMHSNSASRDCLLYGTMGRGGVHLYECSSQVFPFICNINNYVIN